MCEACVACGGSTALGLACVVGRVLVGLAMALATSAVLLLG